MKSQTQVERAFLRSMSVAISVASLILAAAEDSFLPAGLTPFIALATHLLVDRYQKIRISVTVANVLGSIAFIAMALEFNENTLLGKLMSGAHLLVYITWVVLLMPKGIRQYWWIMALGVLQVAVASVLTDDSSFGLSTIVLLFVMIWTLSLFTLFRTQFKYLQTSTSTNAAVTVQDSLNESSGNRLDDVTDLVVVENGIQVDSGEKWIGRRFWVVVCTTFLCSVVVAAVTFVVFPRVWVPESPLAGLTQTVQAALSRTGFSETVQLGDIGEIMQSDARVLQFHVTAMTNRREVTPEKFAEALSMDELLFRGNVMGLYKKGTWDSGRHQGRSMYDVEGEASLLKDAARMDYRLDMTLDPPLTRFAFAPAPVRNIVESEPDLNISKLRYSLTARIKGAIERHTQPFRFEAWYSNPPKGHTAHSADPAFPKVGASGVLSHFSNPIQPLQDRQRFAKKWCITPKLNSTLPQLTKLATNLCSDGGQLVSETECVQRIFRYLNTSGNFDYSLSPRIDDYSIDPVEDFLLNRKSGHCEYFASSCALMLQAVGIPARIVNGYKGFEENTVNGHFEVKQKHAHSWVEVWLDDHWETVDPTPAAARDADVQDGRAFAWWTDMKAVLNDGWAGLIQKMDPEQQKQMIKPLLNSVKEQWGKVKSQGLWATLKSFVTDFLMQPEKWFSFSTLVATFFVLLIPALIFRRNPVTWLRSRALALWQWVRSKKESNRSVVRFYESFRQVCSQYGLQLSDRRTAVENAEDAVSHFSSAWQDDRDRALPIRIASAFNAVRFGNAELPTDQLQALRGDLDRLKSILKSTDLSPAKSLSSDQTL